MTHWCSWLLIRCSFSIPIPVPLHILVLITRHRLRPGLTRHSSRSRSWSSRTYRREPDCFCHKKERNGSPRGPRNRETSPDLALVKPAVPAAVAVLAKTESSSFDFIDSSILAVEDTISSGTSCSGNRPSEVLIISRVGGMSLTDSSLAVWTGAGTGGGACRGAEAGVDVDAGAGSCGRAWEYGSPKPNDDAEPNPSLVEVALLGSALIAPLVKVALPVSFTALWCSKTSAGSAPGLKSLREIR